VTPGALIPTALLLGAFVVLAGVYGLLYSLAVLLEKRRLKSAAYVSYLLHVAVMVTVLAATPLRVWWKTLIAASSVAYLAIPLITWRYLTRIHQDEGTSHDSKPARRVGRTLAGMARRA
jgi:hypothetical protein